MQVVQDDFEQRGRHRVDQNVLRAIDAASAVPRQSPDGVKRPCLSQYEAPHWGLSGRDRPGMVLQGIASSIVSQLYGYQRPYELSKVTCARVSPSSNRIQL